MVYKTLVVQKEVIETVAFPKEMPPFLCFQKALVFVSGSAADVAHSRQFAVLSCPFLWAG